MRLPTLLFLCALGLAHAPARAAESYDNCTGYIDSVPAAITTQGTWCLRKDLATAITGGPAIKISTNNVTIDCNDFKLGGLAAGPGTNAVGVISVNRLNNTIRNCNIRGFSRGLSFEDGGGGHVIEDNRFEGNTQTGIHLVGDNSVIRDNLVLDTGGSSLSPFSAIGIFIQGDGLQVRDNSVAGVFPVDVVGSTIHGIRYQATGAGDADISGNWVRGLASPNPGALIGIRTIGGRPMIHGNRVHAPLFPPTGSVGVFCDDSVLGQANTNLVNGFETAVLDCNPGNNL